MLRYLFELLSPFLFAAAFAAIAVFLTALGHQHPDDATAGWTLIICGALVYLFSLAYLGVLTATHAVMLVRRGWSYRLPFAWIPVCAAAAILLVVLLFSVMRANRRLETAARCTPSALLPLEDGTVLVGSNCNTFGSERIGAVAKLRSDFSGTMHLELPPPRNSVGILEAFSYYHLVPLPGGEVAILLSRDAGYHLSEWSLTLARDGRRPSTLADVVSARLAEQFGLTKLYVVAIESGPESFFLMAHAEHGGRRGPWIFELNERGDVLRSHDWKPTFDFGTDMAVIGDGSVIVVGQRGPGNADAILKRWRPDGTVGSEFGASVERTLLKHGMEMRTLAGVHPDDRGGILLVGQFVGREDDGHTQILRVLTTGQFDPAFTPFSYRDHEYGHLDIRVVAP